MHAEEPVLIDEPVAQEKDHLLLAMRARRRDLHMIGCNSFYFHQSGFTS
jgi:hypothetical protein